MAICVCERLGFIIIFLLIWNRHLFVCGATHYRFHANEFPTFDSDTVFIVTIFSFSPSSSHFPSLSHSFTYISAYLYLRLVCFEFIYPFYFVVISSKAANVNWTRNKLKSTELNSTLYEYSGWKGIKLPQETQKEYELHK